MNVADLIPGFSEAHALAERLYTLQKDQADEMLRKLIRQGAILADLGESIGGIKEDFAEWRLDLNARTVKLETHDADISGNGREGRMKIVENAVVAMGNKFAFLAGMAGLIGVLTALIGWIFPRH